jgi:excisionase family DNA binding protein
MAAEYMSVEQVAQRLNLHPRTVRNYVREGRLKAVRIGKQYRIAAADLESLTGRRLPPLVAESVVRSRHIDASSIVQIDAISADEATSLTNVLIGAAKSWLKSQQSTRVETVYDPERASMKIILVGDLRGTTDILELTRAVLESRK